MRLFIGIPLPGKASEELAQVCTRLRHPADGLSWVAPESWHITLQFLGDADGIQFECVKRQLAAVRSTAVPIYLGSLGFFERAGVFLLEVELTPELAALERRVVQATQPCGFVPEDRPYHPHITLARARADVRWLPGRLNAQAQAAPHLPPFTAKEFLLYESHLGPGGSKYEMRGRYALERS